MDANRLFTGGVIQFDTTMWVIDHLPSIDIVDRGSDTVYIKLTDVYSSDRFLTPTRFTHID